MAKTWEAETESETRPKDTKNVIQDQRIGLRLINQFALSQRKRSHCAIAPFSLAITRTALDSISWLISKLGRFFLRPSFSTHTCDQVLRHQVCLASIHHDCISLATRCTQLNDFVRKQPCPTWPATCWTCNIVAHANDAQLISWCVCSAPCWILSCRWKLNGKNAIRLNGREKTNARMTQPISN